MSEEAVSLDLCICHMFSEFILEHEEKLLVSVLAFPNRYKLQKFYRNM